MRWAKTQKSSPLEIGETRVITKFLFLPKCLRKEGTDSSNTGDEEYRWLEKVTIHQKVVPFFPGVGESSVGMWDDEFWVD